MDSNHDPLLTRAAPRPKSDTEHETSTRKHGRGSGRPRQPAHATPMRGGFAPDPLPPPRPQNPTSQPTHTSHNHPTHPARPHTASTERQTAQQCNGRCSAPVDPSRPTKRPRARPTRWTSTSSKKNGHRATSIAHPVLLKMQRAATQRQHEDDVQMSTMRRPKLAVGVLDAPPLSASISEKDPVLLRHRGRHLSACWVDGVWVRLALAQHYGSTIGEISSSTMHGLTLTCDPVASGGSSQHRRREVCGRRRWAWWWMQCRAVHAGRA